jgi:hypothetical protein
MTFSSIPGLISTSRNVCANVITCNTLNYATLNPAPAAASLIVGDPYQLNLGPVDPATYGIIPLANAGASNGAPIQFIAQSSTTGGGASVQLESGEATAGALNGGEITISAGLAFDGSGGNVVVTAGQNLNGGAGQGGNIFLQTGDSHGTGQSGNFTVAVGSAVGTGVGGSIALTAGNSTDAGADSGSIVLTCGIAVAGDGGAFNVQAGPSQGNGDGGAASIAAGASQGAGDGGNAFLFAGTSVSGAGGLVTVQAGTSASGNGGSVTVNGGDSSSSAGGAVNIRGGNSPFGPAGDIQLWAGSNNTPAQVPGRIKMAPSRNQSLALTDPQSYGGIGIDASLFDSEAPAHFTAYQTIPPSAFGGVIGAGTAGISSDMAGNILVPGTGGGGSAVATVTFKIPYVIIPSVVLTQVYDAAIPGLFPAPTPFLLTSVTTTGFEISVFEVDFGTPLNGDAYFHYVVIGNAFD